MSEIQDGSAASQGMFDAKGRALGIDRGWEWVAAGWKLFAASPGIWVICTLIFLCLNLIVGSFWIIGGIAAHALALMMVAGLMFACAELRAQRKFEVRYLFQAFRGESGPKLLLSFIFAASLLAVVMAWTLMVGAAISTSVITGVLMRGDAMAIMAMIASLSAGVFLAVLVALVLLLPISMGFWFSPALVMFDQLKPLEAMRASFDVCYKNALPILIYGVVMGVLLFVGTITVVGLLVVIPLILTSTYAIYREIFHGDK